ncbi:hypothetical protein WN943_021303 [Citrus x changshan-huyou]
MLCMLKKYEGTVPSNREAIEGPVDQVQYFKPHIVQCLNVVGAVHWIISNQKDKSDRSDSGLNQAGVTSV